MRFHPRLVRSEINPCVFHSSIVRLQKSQQASSHVDRPVGSAPPIGLTVVHSEICLHQRIRPNRVIRSSSGRIGGRCACSYFRQIAAYRGIIGVAWEWGFVVTLGWDGTSEDPLCHLSLSRLSATQRAGATLEAVGVNLELGHENGITNRRRRCSCCTTIELESNNVDAMAHAGSRNREIWKDLRLPGSAKAV